MLRTHVDHCIETLRIAITCVGDTTPLLIATDPNAPDGGSPDMETLHRCRKFDHLMNWLDIHQL